MKQLLLQSFPDADGNYGGAVLVYTVNADRSLVRADGVDLGGSDSKRGSTIRKLMDAAPAMVTPEPDPAP